MKELHRLLIGRRVDNNVEKVFDYIIYEGSLAGCLTAVYESRKGYRVALIERRGFLGSDITATLRMVSLMEKNYKYHIVKELIFLLKNETGGFKNNGEMKRCLLDWVEENGVEVFLAQEPCALLLNESANKSGGLLLSGKWGYFLLKGNCIIDAGQRAVIKRMLDDSLWMHTDRASMTLCYKTNGAKIDREEGCLSDIIESLTNKWPKPTVKEQEEAKGICYKVHYNEEVSYLEVTYSVKEKDPLGDMYRKGQDAMLSAWKLLKKVNQQAEMKLIISAYEPYIQEQTRIEVCEQVKNLYHLHAGEHIVEGLEQIAEWLSLHDVVSKSAKTDEIYFIKNREIVLHLDDFIEEGWDTCEIDLPLQKLSLRDSRKLPVLLRTGVVVAGGGTSGVAAAMGAARGGAETVVIEYHNGLGGTQTYGGIGGYYFCHKNGFANQFLKAMESYGLQAGSVSRMLWYGHAVAEEGIQICCGTAICDVIQEGCTVQGVVVVCDGKWGVIRGDVTVDATGDGDLMEFAGVPNILGAADSGNVQDCGMQYYKGTGYNLDAIYQSKYEEVLRGIRMAHRFSGGFDFSPLLTPREGRAFKGEYIVHMSDILLHKGYADTIALSYTDNDPHGAMSSMLSYMGVTPFHGAPIMVEIPYSACIPKGYSGLLAASKSVSASQDAAAYMRMAGDLQNKGYAIGIAAAMAVLAHCDVRDISVDNLRNVLRHMQILDSECFEVPKKKSDYKLDKSKLIAGLEEENSDCLAKVLCLPTDEIVPLLKEAYVKKPDCVSFGIALAWFGERDAVLRLKAELKRLAEVEDIEDYNDKNLLKPGNNMGGIMGQINDYWRINQLLTVFTLLGETGIEDEIQLLLRKFTSGGSTMRKETPYVAFRWDLHKIPHYDRLRSLLLYICRVPSSAYERELELLTQRELLTGFLGGKEVYDSHNLENDDKCVGRQYQSAYMELSLGEALLLCGSQVGKEILEKGLKDVHYILRRRAYHVLQKVESVVEGEKVYG